VGIWVFVGFTEVGVAGEASGVCCTDWVNAAKVEAILVATVPVSVTVTPPCGKLQAARRMMSNSETTRRGKIGFIYINTPSFLIWMRMCFHREWKCSRRVLKYDAVVFIIEQFCSETYTFFQALWEFP